MKNNVLSFRETLTAAASLVPGLLNADGEPNTSAIAEYCKENGHEVSQPTLSRHLRPKGKPRKLNDDVAKALSAVFHIPARIWKGEPMSDDEARMITEVGLPALLMARKLEKLPPKFRQTILEQIEQAHEHEKLKRAVDPKKTDGS
jgi:hypothetical protein